ncbi:methyltransferase domain-containing protein [Micromonospora sp. NPDC049559]|uniref:class I SAM-dependent methyltransferase n=1 Tax=Micromonospora sp. NPDC049559 TaxID=3155923 RepID=UPI00341A8EA4
MIDDAAAFLAQLARHPFATGAIAPSGPTLARLVTVPIAGTGSPVVVELGPGTGAFTGAIQRRLGGRGRHVAIELNRSFAERLRGRFPGVEVVHGDAGKLGEVLAARGIGAADAVVSGLPWAVFPPQRQDLILRAVAATLAPYGALTTFAYRHGLWTPLARRARRVMEACFEEVTLGRTVWANLPPAVVYHCRRPVPADARPSSAAGRPELQRAR